MGNLLTTVDSNFIGTTFLGINSSYFVGYCRHGSNEYNLIKSEILFTEAQCRSACSDIDNCVAFAFKTGKYLIDYKCYYYSDGPYTYGSGEKNVKCYNMRSGTKLLILKYCHGYLYNIIQVSTLRFKFNIKF